MRRFASTLVAAAAILVASAAAPATAAVVAYRVDLWAFAGYSTVNSYSTNLTAALTSDLAGVFGTSASAVTLKDYMLLPDTSNNISAVFTVNGGSETTFLASPREALSSWTNATNDLLAYVLNTMAGREAAVAVDGYYDAAWITKVERLGSADVLPKTRFLEMELYGKHLRTATASMGWSMSLFIDLANAFDMPTSVASELIVVSRTNSSGVNNSTLTMWFSVKPLLNVAVNTTKFFAASGSASSLLPNCATTHAYAAYDDLGIAVSRGAAALDDLSAEIALTVTSTSVAPGDQAYTNAPSPTNAPGGAAAGVTTAAAFAVAAVALVGASMALF